MEASLPKLDPSEKVTPITVYTANGVLVGQLRSKQAVRVNTWLRLPNPPDFLCVYSARLLQFPGAGQPESCEFPEVHIPSGRILAYHLAAPASEPLDYDPTETARRFEPTRVLWGPFRADGNLRVAQQMTLARYLEVNRDVFTSLYDAEISCSLLPGQTISTPLLLFRPALAMYVPRTA